MMNQFLLICTNPDKNANDLLKKLKTCDKWELTLDAGNIAPGSSASYRINTNLSHRDVEAELSKIFQEPLFFAVQFYKP